MHYSTYLFLYGNSSTRVKKINKKSSTLKVVQPPYIRNCKSFHCIGKASNRWLLCSPRFTHFCINVFNATTLRLGREATVFFDLRRSPNTWRASGEGRKGVLALLHVQRYTSLEGAAPGTTGKKFAFFWLFANAQRFMNTEQYIICCRRTS